MVLGISLTVLNVIFNVILDSRARTDPGVRNEGRGDGTSSRPACCRLLVVQAVAWRLGGVVPARKGWGPDWEIIRALFRFGLPTGFQGIAMNIGGVLMLSFIGSVPQGAAAQAAFAVCYSQLFSLVTWTSVGLMGAAAAIAGQNLGAGNADRAASAVHVAARIGVSSAAFVGILFMFLPHQLLAIFGMRDPVVVAIGVQLLRVLSVSGLLVAVALTYTGGLQGTGDTKSPLYISIISQIVVPLGICFVIQQTSRLDPIDIWIAILVGHATRCLLSVLRFNQGSGETSRWIFTAPRGKWEAGSGRFLCAALHVACSASRLPPPASRTTYGLVTLSPDTVPSVLLRRPDPVHAVSRLEFPAPTTADFCRSRPRCR
jgi:hypothetical protein